jgi:hypothetical protein
VNRDPKFCNPLLSFFNFLPDLGARVERWIAKPIRRHNERLAISLNAKKLKEEPAGRARFDCPPLPSGTEDVI